MHGEGAFTGPGASWLEKSGIPEELYDTQSDPHCLCNLATDPAQAGRLAEMRAALREWQVRVKDLGFLPESIMARTAETIGAPAAIPAATLAALPDLALAWQQGETARNGLLAALGSANAAKRHWAAFGLGQLQDEPTTVLALRAHLKDVSPAVTLAAAWSLHRLGHGDTASVVALRAVLAGSHPIELMEAIQIAHHLGPAASDVRADLVRLSAMKTPPPFARQIAFAAEFALSRMPGPPLQ
ncbi:MAG: HEAT repeat domain-containing protein [Opitutaceae bacterium]|nr:HEAT repeat domain-containing protein [Opitutaceae bacterium]